MFTDSVHLWQELLAKETNNMTEVEKYEELLFKIIHILKMDLEHERTKFMVTPSQLLDKIACMARDLPSIRAKIYEVK